MKFHPSAMRRILNCSASKNEPDIKIDTPNKASDEGNAYHEIMERAFKEEIILNDIIAQTEEKYDVTVGFMVYNTIRMTQELEKKGVVLDQAERKIKADFGDYVISGRFDALGSTESHCVLVDFKGGYKDTTAKEQLLSYASVLSKNGVVRDFKVITIYGRLNTYEVLTVDQIMIQEFDEQVKKASKSNKYQSGSWCEYCPKQYECPAKNQMLNSAVLSLGTGELMANPADLYDRVKEIKKAVKNYEDQFKDYVLANGEVKDSSGKTFYIKESESAEYINTPDTVKAIKERLGDDYFDNQKIGKTVLKKAIMDSTERGIKKSEWESFESKLQEIEGGHVIKTKQTLSRK